MYIYLSIHLSIYLSIYLSVYLYNLYDNLITLIPIPDLTFSSGNYFTKYDITKLSVSFLILFSITTDTFLSLKKKRKVKKIYLLRMKQRFIKSFSG